MLWIVLAVLAVLLVFVVLYNKLIRLRNRVDEAWAQIDVQLRRRYDLIPNLVETVKGYAAHERATLEAVTAARGAAQSVNAPGASTAAIGQAEGALTNALRGLLAVAEAYPDLKANQSFLRLQEELKSTENKIAFARQYYNDIVTAYNTKLETFPSSIFATAGGFKPKELFEVDEPAAREAVKVQF